MSGAKDRIRDGVKAGGLEAALDKSLDSLSEAFVEGMVSVEFPLSPLGKHLFQALALEAGRLEGVGTESEAHNLVAYWATSGEWVE